MKVLGIDTILHSTCVAVVEGGNRVLSNMTEHHDFKTGELFSLPFGHVGGLGRLIEKALKSAKLRINEINLIAVNNFGSQISNVLIGMAAAKIIGHVFNIPIIGVSHQEAHIFSCWLGRKPEEFRFPITVLSSSGGHTAIVLIKNNKLEFKTILEIEGMKKNGKNLPNFRGIGAIYGFVAYALGWGNQINGAPWLSEMAQKGNSRRFNLFFLRPANTNILDFTFLEQGIKSFLMSQKKCGKFSPRFIVDFAASFEHAVSEIALEDLLEIAGKYRAKEIHLTGGISANRVFRLKLPIFASRIGTVGRFPVKSEFSTDNAAMTASLGYYRYKQNPGKYRGQKISLVSNLRLEKIALDQLLSGSDSDKDNRIFFV